MRRLVALLLVAAAAAVPASTAAAATLTRVGDEPFPDRAFVLSLPEAREIVPSRVEVRENGKPVDALTVLPASAAGKRAVGTVLVIDTSRSMRGGPIAGAMAAARKFAERRTPDQQLGVVTFNRKAVERLALTDDPVAIERALVGTPELGRDTHIYDAVATAVKMVTESGVAAGSVVVLSDGADNGSRADRAAVVRLAQDSGVRVFTVGLRSGAFDPEPLRALAQQGGGSFSQASSADDLRPIYDSLATRLSSEYVIRYRSLARPHKRVRVEASVLGTDIRASQSYATPALANNPPPPFERSFWESSTALLVATLAAGALFGIGFTTVLKARPHRRSLRVRMQDFVTPPGDRSGPRAPRLSERVYAGTDRTLARQPWWATFKEEVEVARVDVAPVSIVLGTITATVGAMWLLVNVTGSAAFAVFGLAVPLGVKWMINFKLERERRLFSEQLAETLQVIASAMRAGQSFSGALAVAVQDAPQPTRREFDRVVSDERLGVPLDESLAIVARRMKNRDLEQVELVASLQRETGGNMSEVLEQASATIRERGELRRLIRTLTAQGRMSRWVVSALPPSLMLILSAINPTYMAPLLHTAAGRTVLAGCAVMVVAGSYAIKRIVDIKV